MLNDSLTFDEIDLSHRRSFQGLSARKDVIRAGTILYKFTDWDVFSIGRNGRENVSSFWGTMPDLYDLLGYAQHSNQTLLQCLRQRNAVLHNWNGLNSLVVIRLRENVAGFVGNIGPQTEKGYGDKVIQKGGYTKQISLWGGASQVYLPELSRTHVAEVIPAETVYVRDPITQIVDFLRSYGLR